MPASALAVTLACTGRIESSGPASGDSADPAADEASETGAGGSGGDPERPYGLSKDCSRARLAIVLDEENCVVGTGWAIIMNPIAGLAHLRMGAGIDPSRDVADDETHYVLTLALEPEALLAGSAGDTFRIDGEVTMPPTIDLMDPRPWGAGSLTFAARMGHSPEVALAWFEETGFGPFVWARPLTHSVVGDLTLTDVTPRWVSGEIEVAIDGQVPILDTGMSVTRIVRGSFDAQVLQCLEDGTCWRPDDLPPNP